MKKTIFIFILVITIALLSYHFYPRKSVVAPSLPEVWVQTMTVKAEDFPISVKVIGNLVAPNVKITPEAAGHVDKILFADGAKVEAGTVLVQLNDKLENAKALSADAQLDYALANYKRTALLSKRGAISQKATEEALAELKAKKALAEENKVLLNKMQLHAPFAGYIGRSKINVGEYVNIGQEVATLSDNDHIRVEYSLPEHYRPLLKVGQDVIVTTPTYIKQQFKASLAYISPTVNVTNRSIMLYASVPNPDGLLVPGMFVTVSQSLGDKKDALMIPARSLMVGANGEEVFKVVDGKAFSTKVTVGERADDKIQIVSGLKMGDQIITDGQLKVKNSMPVKLSKNIG